MILGDKDIGLSRIEVLPLLHPTTSLYRCRDNINLDLERWELDRGKGQRERRKETK